MREVQFARRIQLFLTGIVRTEPSGRQVAQGPDMGSFACSWIK